MHKSCFLCLILLISHKITAQEDWQTVEPTTCFFSTENAHTQIVNQEFLQKTSRLKATSSIDVTYDSSFPAAAKAAFAYAVGIWEKYIISTQTIRITANWQSLTGNTLAQTGTTRIYRNFTNAPIQNTWYPVALAESLIGKDLNDKDFEVKVTLNSNVNWYYGTDAKVSSGRYDLVTVSLHEIAHGIGFTSSFETTSNGSQALYGQSNSPYVFDTFIQNTSKQKLTNAVIFGNPSIELKNALTSNSLFFGMKNPKFQTALPKLYAPTAFVDGVSISHFDEATYPSGSPNSLMSPAVKAAEANHVIGDVLLNTLNEMGWQISGLNGYFITNTENDLPTNQRFKVYPNPVEEKLTLELLNENLAEIKKIELLNILGKTIQSIDNQQFKNKNILIDTKNLQQGLYFLAIQFGENIIIQKIMK